MLFCILYFNATVNYGFKVIQDNNEYIENKIPVNMNIGVNPKYCAAKPANIIEVNSASR